MVTANYKQIALKKNKASSLKAYNYITKSFPSKTTLLIMSKMKQDDIHNSFN